MTTLRLDSVSPQLAGLYRRADVGRRRRAAVRACEIAVAAARVESAEVALALDALRLGAAADPLLRRRLEATAADFDDEYLRLWTDEEATEETKADALRLFSKARATAALTYALLDDDEQLHEAIYEALAVMEDPARIVESVASKMDA